MLTQQQPTREIPLTDFFLSVPVALGRAWQQTSKASRDTMPLQKSFKFLPEESGKLKCEVVIMGLL